MLPRAPWSRTTSATRSPTPIAGSRIRQQRRDRGLGRGREQGHLRLPGDRFPAREPLKTRLTKLWNYERYRHAVEGGRVLHLRARTTACRTRRSSTRRSRWTRRAEVLIDPNTLSADGTVALAGTALHRRRQADGVRAGRPADPTGTNGACATWRPARTCRTSVKWSKFSGAAWLKDGSGFYLRPLRRAEGRRRAAGVEPEPEGLLPQARHAAGRGHARLRAAGSPDWGFGADGHRRRPLPARLPERRHASTRTGSSCKDLATPRRHAAAVPRQVRRRLHRRRQRRPDRSTW